MNFEYEYDNRGNIISEKRNGLITKYQYDALGQLIYVNDPHENAIWYYTYDCGGNILEKKKYARNTDGTTGTLIETIPYEYGDSNWKDKLTKYNGKTITYDAIGNPLDDGERQYEWEAGRRLKKVTVRNALTEGTTKGVDEPTGTTLEIDWRQGNLLPSVGVITFGFAKVIRDGVDVTDEYEQSAFTWTRDSGDPAEDERWTTNMNGVVVHGSDLNGKNTVKITCTLAIEGGKYGTVSVDDQLMAQHSPSTLDADDTFKIVNGNLQVTTDRGSVYALESGEVKGSKAGASRTIVAESRLFGSQPETVVEFAYDSNGLRTQKKVTKFDGTVEITNYTLHGKLLTEMTCGEDRLHFFYDAQNRPAKVNYNGVLYTYVHNLQGAVVGIFDNAGKLVVEYKYNVWNKLLYLI